MVKCEMHLHTLGGSSCGRVAFERIALLYFQAGYKAITVTNHYMKYIMDDYYPPLDKKGQITHYISLYKELKNCCAPYGINVFLGLELNLGCLNTPTVCPAAEFLCYGVTEDFLYAYPCLYDYSQKDFFELCNRNGILMYQSHPYRSYCVQGDFRYMHGVEIFNGHPTIDSHNDKAEETAKQLNLLKVSGSDFHVEENSITGGIYIPEDIDNSMKLVDYIKNNELQFIRNNHEA